MFKFAFKVGIAAFATYQLKEEGVWRNSVETRKVLDRLNKSLEPTIVQVKNAIPIELPQFPKSIQLRKWWNDGVLATFYFVADFPHRSNIAAKNIMSSILDHPEVKKIVSN